MLTCLIHGDALTNKQDIITQVQDRIIRRGYEHGTVPIFSRIWQMHLGQQCGLIAVYGRDDVNIIADHFQLALVK